MDKLLSLCCRMFKNKKKVLFKKLLVYFNIGLFLESFGKHET